MWQFYLEMRLYRHKIPEPLEKLFGLNQEMNQISYRVEVYNIYDVLMVTLRLGSRKEGF